MRLEFWALALSILLGLPGRLPAGVPTYTVGQAVALAQAQNPEIAIARKKMEAAKGGLVEARAGYLPWVISTGLLDKRQEQEDTRLRNEDYNASLRLQQNVYTGGATTNRVAIARLKIEQADYDFQETANRITMETRIAFYEALLNRAKIRVHEDSVRALDEEAKNQEERLRAGLVGTLNVQRAEVALANERPELIDAQTQLKNSYLRLAELLGVDFPPDGGQPPFEIAGELEYLPGTPAVNECLARADAERPLIKTRQREIEIEDRQYIVDRSELHPHVGVFSGYEVYSERDPAVGQEFNHGYVFGISGTWNIFDGFATRGRMQATRARRDAAVKALEAARRAVASEVRSTFFDLQQSDRVLESERKNVHTADESLAIARSNFAAGLGTQLDILQAASDVTRTRTTRLGAIYLHNAALARLARACASTPESLAFMSAGNKKDQTDAAISTVAEPPANLGAR
ncbi:MAG: TolC family protein [Chthoniobacterales bacterium]